MNTDPQIADFTEQARRAAATYDWRAAAEAYEQALALTPADDAPAQAPLLTSLGRCYRYLAEARSAWRCFMRAIAIYKDQGDALGVGATTDEALWIWCPPQRRAQLAEDALAMLPAGAPPGLRASLLLRLNRADEARALARDHDLADVDAVISIWDAWDALNDGQSIDDALAMFERAHRIFADAGEIEGAADALRDAGFTVLARGGLDDGERLAHRAWDFAREKGLRFAQQLAGYDVAGVAFCREKYDRCIEICDSIDGDLDFRGDIFRSHVASLREDHQTALALMPSPERGGGNPGAMSQVHAARASVLWAAGRRNAAAYEIEAWTAVERDHQRMIQDTPAIIEALIEFAGDALLRKILENDEPDVRYATLQGRGVDHARAALNLRLGDRETARTHLARGLAWSESANAPRDRRLCEDLLSAI